MGKVRCHNHRKYTGHMQSVHFMPPPPPLGHAKRRCACRSYAERSLHATPSSPRPCKKTLLYSHGCLSVYRFLRDTRGFAKNFLSSSFGTMHTELSSCSGRGGIHDISAVQVGGRVLFACHPVSCNRVQ